MTYLVMETHPAYAVLLDEEGRFLKAANLHYQVGDKVENIVELRRAAPQHTIWRRQLAGLAGLAACLCLAFFGWYQPNYTPYGTLRIQINPDVEMTLSRTQRVLELEGLNPDGQALIEGYDYHGKDRDTAAEELVERAIDLGYLSGGETVSIAVSSSDAAWRTREEESLQHHLEERYGDYVVIRLGVEAAGPDWESPPTEVVIPVGPSTPSPSPSPAATLAPAPSPTPVPTPSPSPTPTPVPTPSPSPTPTPVPTPTPPPLPVPTPIPDTDYSPGSDGDTDYDDAGYPSQIEGDTDYIDWEDEDDGWENEEDDNSGEDD